MAITGMVFLSVISSSLNFNYFLSCWHKFVKIYYIKFLLIKNLISHLHLVRYEEFFEFNILISIFGNPVPDTRHTVPESADPVGDGSCRGTCRPAPGRPGPGSPGPPSPLTQ
jgi:hypothetical protein